MFEKGTIWAYPTDTSFGLGVRADDFLMLEKLRELKKRSPEKYFSLMCRDFEMLNRFAHIPDTPSPFGKGIQGEGIDEQFFLEKPRTAILKPKKLLPKTHFWPENKVAFRLCTLPEIAQHIDFPVTATSANISGKEPIYTVKELEQIFGSSINIFVQKKELPLIPPSEIWDFTVSPPKQIR